MISALVFWCLASHPAPPSLAEELKIGATLEAFGAVYFQGKNQAEKRYGEIRLRPTASYAPLEPLLFYVEGDFRADSEGFAESYMDDPAERSGRRWIADLREAYIDCKADWLGIRIGKQIFDWSVTDTVSPSDNISPRDWTDILESERVGVPAVSLRFGYSTYAELVYMPWFTPSKLPVIGGRWERDLPPALVNGEQEILGRDNGQVSLRTGTTFEGFDIGAVYYRGYGYSPSFRLSPVAAGLFELIPVYRFEEVYAASVAGALGMFGVRGELGYFSQSDEDDFVQYVLGIDREWSGILKPVDSLYVLVQYANEIVTQHDNPVGFPTIDFRRILNNAVMAKVAYSFDGERIWTIKLEGSYNLGDKDSFLEPAIVWRKRSFELEAGIDILSGGKSRFFGGYRRNDRFYSKLTYKF